ncbi:MAG TPA: hypothetical protein VJM83_03140, partial [Nitrospirota bacterium]|nr:hypothetical protein [Nitrospirota bacterium]
MKFKPIDISKIKTYSLGERKSKVDASLSARPFAPGGPFAAFLEGLPDILAGRSFREVARAVAEAKRGGKQVILGMGAHVIKVGLAPLVIDLMERGVITAVAMNGAGIVHDFEMAYQGRTSEDVDSEIETGAFGMAEETGRLVNEAVNTGVRDGLGTGAAVGRAIAAGGYRYPEKSILAAADRLG